MTNKSCESCLMPLSRDIGPRESEKYCSNCFRDGKLVYEGDNLKAFQKVAYDSMVAKGASKPLAWFYTWMIRFAPRWKNK